MLNIFFLISFNFNTKVSDVDDSNLSLIPYLTNYQQVFYLYKNKKEFNMISKDLLDILCCPETKADLVLDGDTLVSTDRETRRRYRIEDDIPIMLIEESEQLSMEEWIAIMKKHDKSIE